MSSPGIPAGLAVTAAIPLPNVAKGMACILSGTIREFFTQDPSVASLSFMLAGELLVHRRSAGVTEQYRAVPGTFDVSPAGIDVAFRTEGWFESLNLRVPDEILQDHARDQLGHRGPRVVFHVVRTGSNPDIVKLGQSFARLVREPRPGAALYAESLWTQIVLQLLWHHSSLDAGLLVTPDDSLTDARMAKVVAFLEANLERDTTLADLAALVDLSPTHFLRAFKKATGRSPHLYRMELRAARAREFLRDPSLSVAEVATLLGYTSPAHFATSFKRHTGTSPAAYRRSVFGGKVRDE